MSPVDPTTLYLHRKIFDQQLPMADPQIVMELKGLWVDDEPRMTEELEQLFQMASDALADFEEEKLSPQKKRQKKHEDCKTGRPN